jgi:hypothetical protein
MGFSARYRTTYNFKVVFMADDTKVPYMFTVLESEDGTFSCNILCRGFPSYEDAVSFIEMWDAMVNDEKIISYELH